MPPDNEQAFREVPDHWLHVIVQYVTGFQNMSDGKEFSDPIVKPALINIYPLFLLQYGLLCVFSVLSNVYLIYYIMRCRLYRDVTHAFLMNLAVCHFVQSFIVMPVTLMVIIIQNWIYGQFLCFFLPLLQVSLIYLRIIKSNLKEKSKHIRSLEKMHSLYTFLEDCLIWDYDKISKVLN